MKKYRTYDRNFKEKAVKLGYEKGQAKAAKELDIARPLMSKWRQEILKYGTQSFCGVGKGHLRLNPEQKKNYDLKIKLKRKLRESELKIEIFKNSSKYVSQGKLMIYHFIENNTDKYSLSQMCEVLRVNRNTYLKWRSQVISPRQRQIILLKQEITSIFFEYKEIYGGAKIAAELQSRGFKIQHEQVAIHMKKLGLVSKIRRNLKRISDYRNNHYVFPNILNRQLNVEEPCQVWVSSITSLQTIKGFLYLTVIMDLFDSNIVGWELSNGLTTRETTLPAWEMAVFNLKTKLIFHSDKRAQYASKMFSDKLDSYKCITRSMSPIASLCDNGISESFFNSIKSALVNSNMLLTEKEMKEKVFEYIDNWHKNKGNIPL